MGRIKSAERRKRAERAQSPTMGGNMNATGLLIGLIIIGIISAVFIMVSLMKNRMIVTYESPHSFEDTQARFEALVPEYKERGWGMPMDMLDMYDKLDEKGQAPGNISRMISYFLCNPAMARKVLEDSPHMSAIMPCSWSIYEMTDGRVIIAKMNVGLMSRIFGGVIRDTMGKVEETEQEILEKLLNQKTD